MAVSFTAKEKESIVRTLRRAAARHAAAIGMRKTTVDELALEAGISKGAFYKFYPSKEYLFLDMLEQWNKFIYDSVARALSENPALPPRQRAALMLKTCWRIMRDQPLIRFCQEELPLMLRKLPEPVLREHYQSEEAFIGSLISRAEVHLSVPEGEACAVVRILLLSLLTASRVGKDYECALDELVDGACIRIVRDE